MRPLLPLAQVPLRDALGPVDAYDAALASPPPIPGFVYKSMQKRLDQLWKSAARSPTKSQGAAA